VASFVRASKFADDPSLRLLNVYGTSCCRSGNLADAIRQIADVNVAPSHNGEGCMEEERKGVYSVPGEWEV